MGQAPQSPAHLEEVLHVLPRCLLPHGRVGVLAHHVVDGLHDVQHFLQGKEQGCRVDTGLCLLPVPSPLGSCSRPQKSCKVLECIPARGHLPPQRHAGAVGSGEPTPYTDLSAKPSSVDIGTHLFGDAAVFVQVVEVEGPVQAVIDGAPQDDGQPGHKILQGWEAGGCHSHRGGLRDAVHLSPHAEKIFFYIAFHCFSHFLRELNSPSTCEAAHPFRQPSPWYPKG